MQNKIYSIEELKELGKKQLYNISKKLGKKYPNYVGASKEDYINYISNPLLYEGNTQNINNNLFLLGYNGKYINNLKEAKEILNEIVEIIGKEHINKEKKEETFEERLKKYIKNNIDIFEVPLEKTRELLYLLTKQNYLRNKYKYLLETEDEDGIKHEVTLSNNYLLKLKKNSSYIIEDELEEEPIDTSIFTGAYIRGVSDPEYIMSSNIIFLRLIKEEYEKKPMPNGGFIPYILTKFVENNECEDYNTLKNDWYRYVPNEKEGIDCLGNCIKIAEIENKIPEGSFNEYVSIRLSNTGVYSVRQKDLKKISELLGIRIHLHRTNENGGLLYEILKYPSKKSIDGDLLEIYEYKEHYFLYERTKYTKWSITDGYNVYWNNKLNITKHHIYDFCIKKEKISTEKRDQGKLTSLAFIVNMIKNKELIEDMDEEDITDQIKYDFKIDHSMNIGLRIPKSNKLEIVERKASSPFFMKKDGKKYIEGSDEYEDRIYADFETYLDNNGKHIADMLVVIYKDNIIHYKNPIDFLNDISRNNIYGNKRCHIIICHNLGYDFNFFAKVKGLNIQSRISPSSSKIKCANCMYYGKYLYFKDSLSLIPYSLDKFDEVFGYKDIKKGACPYQYFNEITIKEEWANIEECLYYVKNDKKEDFLKSVIEYINPDNIEEYNHNLHRLDYCKMDVKLLQRGYEEFRQWVRDLFDEELDFCITIPQIAFNYLNNKGCFEGVPKVRGITLHYLNNFIVGGRCMSAWNKKYQLENIQDFDANSLYPSAMCREDFIVPMGVPRKLEEDECKNWSLDKFPYYYISIKINKVGIARAFPLIYDRKEIEIITKSIEKEKIIKGRVITKDSIKEIIESRKKGFTNYPDKDDIIYVSKIFLEDLVKFQQIEYEVLGGLVYDECESNDKIKKVMKKLFKLRNKLKLEGKQSQEVVKLIQNGSYGRMIMKPVNEIEKYFSQYKIGEKFHGKYVDFIHRHYNEINSIDKYDNFVCINKHKSILEHSNYAQVGINVLDMSKRIMNEVMCLAEDNNIQIFYQDTDSMHMYAKDIPKLKELFLNEYGRELEGKLLHQFKSDFKPPKCYENPIAINTIILGKKSYIDILKSTKINRKIENLNNLELDLYNALPKEKITPHIRMKGVPLNAILDTCKKNNFTEFDFYNSLYYGEYFECDLLADNGCSFRFDKYEVKSELKFMRTLYFPDEIKSNKQLIQELKEFRKIKL